MKRDLLYILMVCLIFTFTACDDSIEDAVSKHVYGENENPYLRTDNNAVATKNMEFAVGHITAQSVKLADYAEKFLNEMNMTVDQVISGLDNGTVVFYNINTTRGIWDKSAMTKSPTGWYYNSAGGVCAASDATQTASIDIDKTAKTLIVNMNEKTKAGTLLTLNIGFAVKGPDYDKYVRFTFNLSATDPSIVLTSIKIPAGDYNSFGLDFNNYAKTIQTCMGKTVKQFLSSLDTEGGSVHMYVINNETVVWDETSSYTASPPGYWINDKGAVCKWNATGFSLYAETNVSEQILYIGRAPAMASGTKFKISVGYKDKNNTKNYFRFIITATLE